MTKNWAIAIGINDYFNFAPLQYAKCDAERMCNFFNAEAAFDEVYLFSDDSPALELPNGARVRTYPSFGNLQSFLHDRFESPFLSSGDNCWFFFAGHGLQYRDRDYLMPIDANPRNIEATGISVSFVRERLSRSGADNVILMLDACRTTGSRDGCGFGEENQKGVITISSCSPTEQSWEVDALQQGAFTHALLEAFQVGGDRNCATVEQLSQYLRHRVPEICRQYVNREQTPRISTDPLEKMHFILMPKFATLADVLVLREKAYQAAFIRNNLSWAEQLCIRAIAAANGRDMASLELYAHIKQLQTQAPSRSNLDDQENGDRFATPTNQDSDDEPLKQQVVNAIAQDRQPTPLLSPKPQQFDIGIKAAQAFNVFEKYKNPLKWLAICGLIALTGAIAINAQKEQNPFAPDFTPGWGSSPSPSREQNPFAPSPSPTGWGPSPSPSNENPYRESPSSGWGSEATDATSNWSRRDFNQLKTFLEDQEWEDADRETVRQLAAIVGRDDEGWLDSTGIQQLPCKALEYVDQLWAENSGGQFGFGAQAEIYRGFGGEPVGASAVNDSFSTEEYDRFGQEVGWMKDNDWIFSRDAKFNLSAPRGHLPADSFRMGSMGSLDEGYVLMRYLVNCGA